MYTVAIDINFIIIINNKCKKYDQTEQEAERRRRFGGALTAVDVNSVDAELMPELRRQVAYDGRRQCCLTKHVQRMHAQRLRINCSFSVLQVPTILEIRKFVRISKCQRKKK